MEVFYLKPFANFDFPCSQTKSLLHKPRLICVFAKSNLLPVEMYTGCTRQ